MKKESAPVLRGKNVLEEPRPRSLAEIFWEQMNDPLIYVLLAAGGISLILKEFSDALIILAVILLNAFIGMIQQKKAAKALDSLKKMTKTQAVVRRAGKQITIPASDLIPGDIVCLDAGRKVPADLELIFARSLKVEESSLTGESLPVEKDAHSRNKVYMSTNVTYGRGEGVVTAIGMDTEIGKIARMIHHAPSSMTPLQKRMGDLGKFLSIFSVLLCFLLFFIAVLQKREVLEMLITAISLAVAAVPEGLPAVVTMVLALSVSRMVKVHTIVKRLPCVETLGSVNVICSDKTGTLTQNKMTVTACYTEGRFFTEKELSPYNNRYFLHAFTLCNDAVLTSGQRRGDPTELALLDFARRFGIFRADLESRYVRRAELPFDSNRKRMSTLHQNGDSSVLYTKGSPEEVLSCCTYIWENGRPLPLTAGHKKAVQKALSRMSSHGLRILAAAMKQDSPGCQETGLTFLGLAGIEDPLRPEAKQALKDFSEAGIRTVLITGDRLDTAYSVARALHLASGAKECMTGEELDRLTDPQLKQKVSFIRVFAHVTSSHKVRIVRALKASGNIVAMTGDGVNDAPSLKIADVGIVMGNTGTDVAKDAADIILTDDNFATIPKAIALGRSIYENIRKSILFLLSSNFGEIITMTAAIVIGLPAPLAACHILWVNLITDSLPALALGVDKNDTRRLMKNPPRPAGQNLLAGGGVVCTVFYGFLIGFISIAAFMKLPLDLLLSQGLPLTLANFIQALEQPEILCRAQTYAFTVLGICELFHAVGMRDLETSVFSLKKRRNPFMWLAFFTGLLLQILVTEVPFFILLFQTCRLSLGEWCSLLFLSAMPLFAHELFCLTGKVPVSEKFHNR